MGREGGGGRRECVRGGGKVERRGGRHGCGRPGSARGGHIEREACDEQAERAERQPRGGVGGEIGEAVEERSWKDRGGSFRECRKFFQFTNFPWYLDRNQK